MQATLSTLGSGTYINKSKKELCFWNELCMRKGSENTSFVFFKKMPPKWEDEGDECYLELSLSYLHFLYSRKLIIDEQTTVCCKFVCIDTILSETMLIPFHERIVIFALITLLFSRTQVKKISSFIIAPHWILNVHNFDWTAKQCS